MSLAELKEEFASAGEKSYTASQVYSWLHKHQVSSFDEMTNIKKELRENLKKKYYISDCTI